MYTCFIVQVYEGNSIAHERENGQLYIANTQSFKNQEQSPMPQYLEWNARLTKYLEKKKKKKKPSYKVMLDNMI
jgi:hypothetical protein